MAIDFNLLEEAERRGILPEEKRLALQEARRRDLVPQTPSSPTFQQQATSVSQVPSPVIPKEDILRAKPVPSLPEAVVSGVKAFPGDVTRLASSAMEAMISPIQTAENLKMVAKGLYSKISGVNDPDEYVVDAIADDLKSKYGSYDNFKFSLAERPAQILNDASIVLSGIGSVGAKTANLMGYTRTANVFSKMAKVGQAIDPLRLTFQVTKPVRKLINKANKYIVGNMVTGVGEEFLEQAYRDMPGKDRFLAALRGDEPLENFLDEAKGALSAVRAERGSRYAERLAQIKPLQQELNFEPIQKALLNKLNDYRIKIDTLEDGTEHLNFSDAVVSNARDLRIIRNIFKDVSRWPENPENLTPIGFDTLKRRLDDQVVIKGATKAITTELKNLVKNELVLQVPEYAEMTKDYQDLSHLIENVEDSLALGKNTKAQTAISKLSKMLREDNEFAQQMVGKMKDVGGQDIIPIAAGLAAKPFRAQATIGRRLQEASPILSLMGAYEPLIAIGAAVSSPHVVAEFLNALGKAARTYQKAQQTVGISMPSAVAGLGELEYTIPKERQQ